MNANYRIGEVCRSNLLQGGYWFFVPANPASDAVINDVMGWEKP